MDEAEYTKLLDKAYTELPEVLYKKKRFEIPEVRGRLVKTRTVISNFRDITKQFERPEDHVFKFLLREVGVRGDLQNNGEVVLHSRFQPAMLNKAVERYFKNFVECPNCGSPDTTLDLGLSQLKCKACGHQEKVSSI